jgi:hypothetical protein
MCNGGSDDYCLSIRTVHELLILRKMMGRPGIAKAKWPGLRPGRAVAEESGVALDRITRNNIKVIDSLKTVVL